MENNFNRHISLLLIYFNAFLATFFKSKWERNLTMKFWAIHQSLKENDCVRKREKCLGSEITLFDVKKKEIEFLNAKLEFQQRKENKVN